MRFARTAALLLLLAAAPADASATCSAWQSETFVPTHEEATRQLARGDRACERARKESTEKTWADALDAWQSALEQTEVGDRVPLRVQQEGEELWPDPDETFAQRTEGVPLAVLRRLALLEVPERQRWVERFASLAEERLSQAYFATARLARVERDFPATRAAALACLRLADSSLEAGRAQATRAWIERGELHARLSGNGAPLLQSFERRSEFLRALTPAPKREAWRDASSLSLTREVNLAARISGTPPKGEGFDRGLIQGAVFLDDGRIVIHHPAAVFVVDESGAGPIFEPRKLLEAFPRRSGATFAPGGQAWPLDPATDGKDLYFVLGRAIVTGNTSAVCRLAPPPAAGEAAQLRWVLSTQGHADGSGKLTPIEELLEPGTWEFQPGPATFGSLLIVQARHWLPLSDGPGVSLDTSRPSCFLLALDAATGLPVWSRFLGKGADVQRDFGTRFSGSGRPAAPAQPVAIHEGRAFCATGVGLGALVELVDGRIAWTYLPERRKPDEDGWVRAHRPDFVQTDRGASVLWGPPDSSFLYWLRGTPDVDGTGLELFLPAPIGTASAVLAGETASPILLGFAGASRNLSELDPHTGKLTQGLRLRLTEEFRGPSLASASRVFLCTDRTLYLFDRKRELLLLESHGLRSGNSLGGGSVIAKGRRVAVIGPNRVFLFEASAP